MNIETVEWDQIANLNGGQLKKATFEIIKSASTALQERVTDDPDLLQIVPRLIDLLNDHPEELNNFHELISSLARATGLWNYVDRERADYHDLVLAETATYSDLGNITLHREQVKALNSLLAGKNLILSAPTSFGKSVLVDALLASDRYRRVAIVLPTIALLDEFRRRIASKFNNKYQIIMHPSEIASDDPTIFIGTQERLIYRDDLGQLDLAVVDEFYKLDPQRKDERSITLNAAVYRLLRQSNQFFFLGPNIDSVTISSDTRWQFEFLKTRFSTVAVDTLDLQKIENKRERLKEEIHKDSNWPALVFVSSPGKANLLAIELSEQNPISDLGHEFAKWLEENIGKNCLLQQAAENGIGIHHGRIPRAIAARMVKLFNQGMLPILLCTSTLIEGINTAAKSVMIYDKKINRSNYDFFTFSNIKGRAGRLGQHHVGQVILFNDMPEKKELKVAPTLFGDEENYPDEYIVHIDNNDRSKRSDERISYLYKTLNLDHEDLKLVSSIGLDKATQLRELVFKSLEESDGLIWEGKPKYSAITLIINLVHEVTPVGAFGARSASQLTYFINQLRLSRTLKEFLVKNHDNHQGKPEEYDEIFKFLRACEYGLAQYFSCVELFVKQINTQADYSLFIGELSCWFKSPILKEMDEEGLPFQITERFFSENDTKETLRKKLKLELAQPTSKLTEFEIDWLSDVI